MLSSWSHGFVLWWGEYSRTPRKDDSSNEDAKVRISLHLDLTTADIERTR